MPFMGEGGYMQKIVVMLQVYESQDTLLFNFNEPLAVNLNSEDSQTELKNVFAHLLNLLIGDDIELELSIQEGYSRGLLIDVAQEYIKELNKELKETRKRIITELAVEVEPK